MKSGSGWGLRSLSSIVLLLCVAGCGGVSFNATREAAFAGAVEASLDDEPAGAAAAAYFYIKRSSPDDGRYDRALIILAQSAEDLGLSYAASLWYLDIAAARRDVDLLDKAFAGLERIVMGGGPYDEATLVDGFLATAHIDGLSPERQAFIDYVQARRSVQQGLDTWADKQFAAIPRSSPYYYRARYVKAVRYLHHDAYPRAKKVFEALSKSSKAPADVVLDSELALARLAMEEERYDAAVSHYEEVRSVAKDRPGLLLEMAWAHFYRGDSRRALGLLVALDAPVYGGLIAPERYLLEARTLRRLCQFEPARTAAVRLTARHGDALSDLHAGVRPIDSESMRAGARRRGGGGQVGPMRRRIEEEAAIVEDLDSDLGEELYKALAHIYSIGLTEASRREDEVLSLEVEKLSQELAIAEDGVRLILHELSVGLLRGRRRPKGPAEIESVTIQAGGDNVSYRFAQEFWTDELDDLIVVMRDRCLD